ncbi:MAG: hypothetical protein Q9190_002878 [Brigantiaea leucoxantha]
MDHQWPKHIATYYAQNSQEIPTQVHSGTESQNLEQSGGNVELTQERGREQVGEQAAKGHRENMTSGDSRNGIEEFLQFVPDNEAAQLAFHQLVVKMRDGDLHKHHSQFITVQGRGLLSDQHGHDYGSTGDSSTPDSPVQEQHEEQEVYKGHFSISFGHLGIARGAKWVIGKGFSKAGPERNVDILLAAPDSEHRKHLAPAHAYLRMHMQSGAWMINAGMRCKHVVGSGYSPRHENRSSDDDYTFNGCPHEPVRCNDRPVRHFEFACLSQPQASFMVGGLRYLVRFVVDNPLSEEIYLQYRNAWLSGQDVPIPDTKISCIPFVSDINTRLAVFRRGLGSGSFGTVYEGFEPKTGDLRAVKKLVLKNSVDRAEADTELTAHDTFCKTTGVVRCYGWCLSSGEQQYIPDQPTYPFEIFVSLEKGRSFYQYFYKDGLRVDGKTQSKLCQQLLQGVAAIHSRGWIHRDITPMNILYFDQEPRHAALCDFGKLCMSKTHTMTALAAWRFLPPEIVQDKTRVYNQKIDIWMLGLALIYCWYPQYSKGKDFRMLKDHSRVIHHLTENKDDSFCSLLAQMLAWNAKDRPSAKEALIHHCFQNITSNQGSESLRIKKRPKSG